MQRPSIKIVSHLILDNCHDDCKWRHCFSSDYTRGPTSMTLVIICRVYRVHVDGHRPFKLSKWENQSISICRRAEKFENHQTKFNSQHQNNTNRDLTFLYFVVFFYYLVLIIWYYRINPQLTRYRVTHGGELLDPKSVQQGNV